MIILIETNGATHIAINVPAAEAPKALPALVNLFEKNALFYKSGWRELEEVKPKTNILLGNVIEFGREEQEVVLKTDEVSAFLSEDFEALTPELFLSSKKAIAKQEEELRSLKRKLEVAQEELASLRETLD